MTFFVAVIEEELDVFVVCVEEEFLQQGMSSAHSWHQNTPFVISLNRKPNSDLDLYNKTNLCEKGDKNARISFAKCSKNLFQVFGQNIFFTMPFS